MSSPNDTDARPFGQLRARRRWEALFFFFRLCLLLIGRVSPAFSLCLPLCFPSHFRLLLWCVVPFPSRDIGAALFGFTSSSPFPDFSATPKLLRGPLHLKLPCVFSLVDGFSKLIFLLCGLVERFSLFCHLTRDHSREIRKYYVYWSGFKIGFPSWFQLHLSVL